MAKNKNIKREIFTGGLIVAVAAVFLNGLAKRTEESAEIDADNKYINQPQPENQLSFASKEPTFYEKHCKPLIDKTLSFCGLIVLAPVYAAISLAIVIDDPGPVMFKQKRVGKDKHFFEVHKFRSMKMSTPHDIPTHQLENPDQYITRVGRFLRKTSLDELPQIWDIFRGKMSIIGPRPALWNQEDLVEERDKYGANGVMPGLTGLAQINGRDELEIPDKAFLDGKYVESLRTGSKEAVKTDAKCFIGTIKSVANEEGVVEGGTGEIKKVKAARNESSAKNVLYISHYAGSPEMGMAFRHYYLSREWVKQGYNVTIIAADYSHLRKKNPVVENDFEEELIDGIRYVWVKTGSYEGNGSKRAVTMFAFVGKILANARKITSRYNPDVVITSSTYPLDTYAGQRISKLSGAKYIHEVHDMWPATLYEVGGMSKDHPFVVAMQKAEDSAYKHCDDLVALLPYSKDYMVQHGLDPDKFHNIQNGVVETEWENSEKIPAEHEAFFREHEGQFVVGYFGGHALSNALDKILDIAKKYESDPDKIFVFVGDGVEKERLIERKTNEKIDNAFFLPAVNKKAVPDLLTHFDCSYMTGMTSPLYRFGLCLNKMYDSMMAGLPVICAYDAPDTLVRQYGCGIQCNPDNPEEIIKAIDSISKMTKEERTEMGNKGRQAIHEHFLYSNLAARFSELF